MEAPENIVANAEYHSRLLSTIAELEYVPQAKRDQIEYIKDLQTQIESGQKKIAQLAEKTKKERKEHESLRDSTARRFAHLLVGQKEKFAQKASKEERYVNFLTDATLLCDSNAYTYVSRIQGIRWSPGTRDDGEG